MRKNITKKTIERKTLLLFKDFLSLIRSKCYDKKILFILGCQRSGTTMLTEIFERDLNAKVFGEFSELSSIDKKRIRLNPLEDIATCFNNINYNFIVLKPIVESQRANILLNYFNEAKVLWIYRNYKSVISSNLKKFGEFNGFKDILPVVADDQKDWRSEMVNVKTRNIFLQHYNSGISKNDASGLFWWLRNRIYFDLGLDKNPGSMILKYEELVKNPNIVMRRVYDRLGIDFPRTKIISKVHSKSINKGDKIELNPKIEILLKKLNSQLDLVYYKNLN